MDRREGLKGFFRRKSVLAVNLGVLVLVAWGFGGEYVRNRDMESEIGQLRAQAEGLEARNLELAQLAKRLDDPEIIEREARLKLNLQRPGEEVVVVRDLSPARGEGEIAAADGEVQVRQEPEEVSNARKWFRHFFR